MSDPKIELREAQQYVGIRAPVTAGIRDFADNAFPELFGWVFEHGAAPAGPPFLRYHEVDRSGEPLEVEAGVPVESPPERANGRVRAAALPAGRYLTALHVGPYTSETLTDLADARAELVRWARDNEVAYGRESERGMSFPCALERFIVGPVDDPDFTNWQTEFAYLIG